MKPGMQLAPVRAWLGRRLRRGRQLLRRVRPRRQALVLAAGAIAALLIGILGGAVWARLVRKPPPPLPPPVLALDVRAPQAITAGETLTLTILASPPVSGAEVLLLAQGSDGVIAQSAPLVTGTATLVLAPAVTGAAGSIRLQVMADAAYTATEVLIRPGPATGPLLMLAGPRSILAGGEESTQVVTLPLDAYGNPVADDTAVIVRAQHPAPNRSSSGVPSELLQLTRDLLASVRIASRNVAGALRIAATADSAHSAAQTLRIDPMAPVTVTVQALPAVAAADGQTFVKLVTGPLADVHGNVLLDGAAVYFLVEGSDGTRRSLPAMTMGGQATTPLLAPLAPSTQVVRAVVADVVSAPITVTFRAGTAVQPFQVEATRQADVFLLTAGPLLGELGELIADDTPVQFSVSGPGGWSRALASSSTYGYATATLFTEELYPGVHTVVAQVGGATGQTQFRAP